MDAARDLGRAMIRFGARLRAAGLPVALGQVTDGVRALDHIDLADREELRLALRAVFVSRPEELPLFDGAFDQFWRAAADGEQALPGLIDVPPAEDGDAGAAPGGQKRETLALEAWGAQEDEGAAGEPLGVPAVSDRESLTGQDFATFSAEQLEEVYRLTIQIARRLARRLSRRRRPVARRGRVDLRRTLRANLSRADLVELRYRQRRRRKARLVLFCDVSGSMDLYSRFLLQFLFALQNVFSRVETFTFSTRLTRVTDYLRGRSYRHVLRRLTEVRDWSGGTRIGASMAQFNREWGHLLDRRTIVILLSDGWDTGEPDVLAAELLRIRRRAGRLIWLNPLLGNPAYEPLTRGMAAALPLVHRFAPAHNLASLRDLARTLTL
ncbi:MAG: vWA domain-containing protein [Candidatus Rokuibacteriota bacterium]